MNAFWWAILTAVIWGCVPLLEKSGLVKTTPFVGLFYRSLGVIIGICILSLFMVKPQELKAIDLKSASFLILGGFLASFVAQICFYHSLKVGEISRVVPVSGTYPLIAFLLGVLLLGEAMTLSKLVGVSLIVAGVIFLKL